MKLEEIERELVPFLSPAAAPHLRKLGLDFMLGLTGSEEGCQFLGSSTKYLDAIMTMTKDPQPSFAKDAYAALVNLTADEPVCWSLLNLDNHPQLVLDLLLYVLQPSSEHADAVCMVLSNISRSERCATNIVSTIIQNAQTVGFDRIIQVFSTENFNPHANLHYLGPFLANLSQIQDTRQYILDRERCVIQRLLPYTEFQASQVRRAGIVATIKNCCFETDHHDWLLSGEVDVLPRLLLPLAGGEEFDEDDTEKLPIDLQYLGEDKQREPDPHIRHMLVDAIHQLCATKACRITIRDMNAYVIMRELHKWEKDPAITVAVENLVHVLISDEHGTSNLKELDIPSDLEAKLLLVDKDIQDQVEADRAQLQAEQSGNEQSED